MALDRQKLFIKLQECPFGGDVQINQEESAYLCELMRDDLGKNSHSVCNCGQCVPNPMFTMLCAKTGKFLK